MAGSPTFLRCEYEKDPIGLGTARPRFSWWLCDDRDGASQSAYRILVASSRDALDRDAGDLWDSGRVASDDTAQIEYEGAPLGSRARACWKVQSFDGDGDPSPWSAPATFEVGLLEPSAWSAAWIASPLSGTPKTPAPVPVLRREFSVAGDVARARLYVTALGYYEAWINGRRVGDHELAPGWTDFRKRVRYQTYDVTSLLAKGENAIGALLGDGYYCGMVGLRLRREAYGERPELCAQLEIVLADGRTETIATDGSWSWQASQIVGSDPMLGETVDLRRDLGDWSRAGRARGVFEPVVVRPPDAIALDAPSGPPVRVKMELAPVGPPTRAKDSALEPAWIYDLGQNMVGRVRLRVRGPRGTSVTVRHAEALDDAGRLWRANLGAAAATDTYTLAGAGEPELLEPRFTFHGFRYVEVTGPPRPEDVDGLVGVVLHSDAADTGTFACSDGDVNRLQQNIVWSQRGNFVDVPTDCPQRSERLGWTGDAQVFVGTAAFNMDVAGFFAKWLIDLEDAQSESGRIPSVAPMPPDVALIGSADGGPAWADAVVVCPWTIWRRYGDTRIADARFDSMRRYVDYLLEKFPDGIRADPERDPWGGYGDWCALDGSVVHESRIGATPKDLIGTAFLRHSARLLSELAAALGRPDEEKRYAEESERVRDAFRRRFVTPDGLVAGNTQTSFVLALHFDLLEPNERARTAAALARHVELHGHLTTGFVGTPYLLHVLTAIGRLDLAYRLLLRRAYPGWLYPVVEGGATTIWERWNGWTKEDGFFDPSMNSFNHYAYGAVGEWMYGTLAGLALDPAPESRGFRRARIAPRPPLHPNLPMPALVAHARAALDTVRGRYDVAWRVDGDAFRLDVGVPAGCDARLVLPDGTDEPLASGRHAIERPVAALRDAVAVG